MKVIVQPSVELEARTTRSRPNTSRPKEPYESLEPSIVNAARLHGPSQKSSTFFPWMSNQRNSVEIPSDLTQSVTLSGKDLDVWRAGGRTSHANHPGSSPPVQKKITPHIPTEIFGLAIFRLPSRFFQSGLFCGMSLF